MMVTDEQKEVFRELGYLVIPDVVPNGLCKKVIDAILQQTGIDLDDRSTWYNGNYAGHGIIAMHHHQALWDLRQHPALHEVFSALYENEKLWVSMDRASYKPPCAPETSEWKQAAIHWDCDPWMLDDETLRRHSGPPSSIQGLVYLTDTSTEQGAFSCVPSIYRDIANWCQDHIDDEHRRYPEVADDDLIAVEGTAGSLVVFNRLMPHTGRLNLSDKHRFVQYVTMQPVTTAGEGVQRVKEWREKMPPQWAVHQKIRGQAIPEPGDPACLSELGRKLVGIDPWP